jgi:hypothetical protein
VVDIQRMRIQLIAAITAVGFVASGQARKDPSDPGTRVVVYEVDGSVHSADLTYVNEAGEIKQKVIELPYKDQFFAPYGAFVSVLAQKRVTKKLVDTVSSHYFEIIDDGRQGTLHVMIRVGGVPFKENETEAEFGIAKASGKVSTTN